MRFVLLWIVVLALAGCGGDGGSTPRPRTDATTATPALGRQPARPGEVVVRGQASPKTDGPYSFDGRYLVRFEQFAPEDAKLDFAAQIPFTASLVRSEGDTRGAKDLFAGATATGRRTITIRGRYFVDVSFGDFPYAVRFTRRSG